MSNKSHNKVINFEQIKDIIPQRFPFLMIDKVMDIDPGVSATGIKNLTGNEWFYQGHFPERAITPGAMICEGIAQTGIVFFHAANPPTKSSTYYLASLRIRFLKPALPGDQLKFRITPIKVFSDRAILSADVTVDGDIIAKGEFSLAVKSNSTK